MRKIDFIKWKSILFIKKKKRYYCYKFLPYLIDIKKSLMLTYVNFQEELSLSLRHP